MHMPSRVSLGLLSLLLGCGGEGSSSTAGFDCESVPACHTAALATLRSCVTDATLTRGSVSANSGVVQGLMCTEADVTIEFSDFSENPTGTVPTPSTVTIRMGDALCAELGSGEGTTLDADGNTIERFDLSEIRAPGAEPVTLYKYDDGRLGVRCGTEEEVIASAGSLDGCAGSLAFHEVSREDDLSRIGVELADAEGTPSQLFTCE